MYSLILAEKIHISTGAFENGSFNYVYQLTTNQREKINILS